MRTHARERQGGWVCFPGTRRFVMVACGRQPGPRAGRPLGHCSPGRPKELSSCGPGAWQPSARCAEACWQPASMHAPDDSTTHCADPAGALRASAVARLRDPPQPHRQLLSECAHPAPHPGQHEQRPAGLRAAYTSRRDPPRIPPGACLNVRCAGRGWPAGTRIGLRKLRQDVYF